MVHLEAENFAARAEYLYGLFESSVDSVGGDRYLAIGSGRGKNVELFGREYDELHAIDIKRKGKHSLIGDFAYADGTRLPYQDDTFDLVTAISIIEHVLPPERRHILVDEIARCTAPGGHIFLQIPNPRFVVELHTGLPFIQWIPRGKQLGLWLGYDTLRQVHIPYPDTLKRWFEDAGITILSVQKVIYPQAAVPGYPHLYRLLASSNVFRAMPFGYAFVGTVE